MPLDALLQTLWLWVAVPMVSVLAVVLGVRLRLPQLTRLSEAFGSLRTPAEDHEGALPSAAVTALSTAALHGAAAAVAAAAAVHLGGPGTLGWVWIFAFLLAPLRMAEVLLSRTSPVGEAGASTGSLVHRFVDDALPGVRYVGFLLAAVLPLVALFAFGRSQGVALRELGEALVAGQGLTLALVVAGLGGVLAVTPVRRLGASLGWAAAFALVAVFGMGLTALLSDPTRGLAAFGRAFADIGAGAPRQSGFSGALASEIALAAFLHLLPPLLSVSGLDGALHGLARTDSTRRQAAGALLAPFGFALLVTLLGLAMVSTGAYARRVEGSLPLFETRVLEAGFETVSQRLEADRAYEGVLRISDGTLGVVPIEIAGDRGMVVGPRFILDGAPADILLRTDAEGRYVDFQVPNDAGALRRRPLEEAAAIRVTGRHLPRRAGLVWATFERAGGPVIAGLGIGALLFLAILAIGAWGMGLRAALSRLVPGSLGLGVALVPAVGVALGALAPTPLGLAQGLLALLVISTTIGLLVKSLEIGSLAGR
jgi:Na+/alanine symporter